MSRAEMDQLGWDSCDIIVVTGDAYVDHPSFGMAIVGRLLEAQGFRVGIIAQPDWHSADAFAALGRPNLFFGITAGNMDSMVNRYTSDRRIRSDDAYTPGGEGGKRPDRSVIVYSQRAREAFKDVPIVVGGIEASLRRIAHFDYWSEKVRRSILLDSKADLLVYGNGERAICEIAHRLAAGEQLVTSPTCAVQPLCASRLRKVGSKSIPRTWMRPGPLNPAVDPYAMEGARLHLVGAADVVSAGAVKAGAMTGTVAAATPCSAASPASTRARRKSGALCPPRQKTLTANAARSACRRTSKSPPTRCCTRTPPASSIWKPTRETLALWCSVTVTWTCG